MDFFTTFVCCICILSLTWFFYPRQIIKKSETWAVLFGFGYWVDFPRNTDPYREWQPGYYKRFWFTQKFTAKTPAQFVVEYELSGMIERVDDAEFKNARMLEESAREALIADFNENVFLPFLNEAKCFFRLRWAFFYKELKIIQPEVRINQVIQNGAERINARVFDVEVLKELYEKEFVKNGCKVELKWLKTGVWNERVIEENFKMLNPETIEDINRDAEFSAHEEATVVAFMKSRLETAKKILQEGANQEHESEMVAIKTERVDGAVKIEWKLKEGENSGYELLGFRKEDGFGLDQWSETGNGALVVHSTCNGSVVEDLKRGGPFFYTFFMRPWRDRERGKRSPIRFQIMLPKAIEVEAIERQISRIEALTKKRDMEARAETSEADAKKEKIDKVLKELGLNFELDEAIEGVEKKLRERIESKNYSREEKEEKLERLKGFVEDIRSTHL